ncbi:MAG: Crp/Fnr family transcriptional regulator [Betaproteobacteria bacterium]|nr:Crp/Fnr family transcriptional regulator [Betaproteobacteria bacterium]MDE2047240.1 Crp/Fnr family transcriptional regulator [Betaproteobacteria bacterium]
MAMLSNLDLIRRVPLFSMLNDEQADRIARGVVKHRYKRGEAMVEQGAKSDKLIILLSGRARVVTRDSRGREAIIAFLNPGEHLGEMSLIDESPHSASVEAEVQTDALVLEKDAFMKCLPENNSLSHAIMLALVRRLRSADRKIESLALLDVYGRVARALLEVAEKDGTETIVRNKITKQDLAKIVGASREMVSRVMKDLEQDGYIAEREDGTLLLRAQLGAVS